MNSGNTKKDACGFQALKSPRLLALCAILAALSIIFGKYIPAFNIDWLRISFENLPILLAGVFLGPAAGAAVGIVADLVGCLLVGYAINPVITLGAAVIGLLSGFIYRRIPADKKLRLFCSVFIAHIIGSMIIKSIGLAVWYQLPTKTILLRVPTYTLIALLEWLILRFLSKSRAFCAQIERMKK